MQSVDTIPKVRNRFRKFFHNGKSPFLQSTPPEGTPPIWVAAINKNWETLKQCLDQDPSLITMTDTLVIDEIEPYGSSYFYCDNITLLHVVATWSDNVEALQYLISLGMDVNTANGENLTPLHIAVQWTSNMDVVKYLISEGADVNARTTSDDPEMNGFTPLYYALIASEVDVAKYLVSKGANINAIDVYGNTALHFVAKYSPDLGFMKYLVSKGANVNARNSCGNTPLHYAAMLPDLDFMKYLVSQGGDVHVKNNYARTLLHEAALCNSNMDVLHYLVSQGLDANAKDNKGYTPLHEANEYRRKKQDYLISQRADVNAKTEHGRTPLHEAARHDNGIEVVNFLIRKGADVHAQDADRKTASDLTDSEELKLYLREQEENLEEPYMTDERKAKTKPLFSICPD